MYFAGVDLGGTKIAAALVDRGRNVLSRIQVATVPEEGVKAVISRITGSVKALVDDAGIRLQDVAGICVGAPGPVDRDAGTVLDAPNLGWRSVGLAAIVARELGRPTCIENDANAAALAESRLGAGVNSRAMLYITVSTGVGGGLVLDGRLYRGARGGAGEIGHITMVPNGPLCSWEQGLPSRRSRQDGHSQARPGAGQPPCGADHRRHRRFWPGHRPSGGRGRQAGRSHGQCHIARGVRISWHCSGQRAEPSGP